MTQKADTMSTARSINRTGPQFAIYLIERPKGKAERRPRKRLRETPREGVRKTNKNKLKMEDNIMVPSRRTQQNWLPAFFNDFFDDDFRHFGNMMRTSSPAINVKENDKEYTVEIAAPGMSKDDFKIRINEENELVVTLEHKDEQKEEKKDEKYLRREFSYSHFEQALLLPDDIKKEEISASMEHGVLNITLPKVTEAPAAPKERFIDIK